VLSGLQDGLDGLTDFRAGSTSSFFFRRLPRREPTCAKIYGSILPRQVNRNGKIKTRILEIDLKAPISARLY
jgi:hypothetical protein